MDLNMLTAVRRERFGEIARELMNHYCILKRDSRDNSDVIYRFAEIEFYLYDSREPDVDIYSYCRDCGCAEWFFHSSGVDIAFVTKRDGDELTRFGGILIRGIEIYRQDRTGRWQLVGVVGGPRLSMFEIFNHCVGMPDVAAIPSAIRRDRPIRNTRRIGIEDDLRQRFVFDDVDWSMATERVVERKDSDSRYRVRVEKTSRRYNPKP